MTAIAEDIDLSWVRFLPCEGWNNRQALACGPCPREPSVVAVWCRPCGHGAPRTAHCPGHRDEILRMLARTVMRCRICDDFASLLRIEALR